MLWRVLRRGDHIPSTPGVIEIGKANWYGDTPLSEFQQDVEEFAPDAKMPTGSIDVWQMADLYYRVMLRDPVRAAIDLDPHAPDTPACPVHRFDLNRSDWYDGGYNDIVINSGTAEHVFDQRAVWESMHDLCKVGGLMVHALPLWGWLDHGFVNYQPTFVADVAKANGYEILAWYYTEIQPLHFRLVMKPNEFAEIAAARPHKSAMMHVAYRKTSGKDFRVPMQGVYSEHATDADRLRWLQER